LYAARLTTFSGIPAFSQARKSRLLPIYIAAILICYPPFQWLPVSVVQRCPAFRASQGLVLAEYQSDPHPGHCRLIMLPPPFFLLRPSPGLWGTPGTGLVPAPGSPTPGWLWQLCIGHCPTPLSLEMKKASTISPIKYRVRHWRTYPDFHCLMQYLRLKKYLL